ncbi:Protein of unknown function [Polynucleobacter meluiroseus]|jgi:hypothetical protein|uniref:DUF1488 domain-containing protein n=1 Tax=Polynucleobacter meluiroseus TaxID=1938814 RepID=A0A240E264_9BURK|nr:DUF1488 family protein [Polynucleobacter meluiroseus]SNX29353.1 Protein of unknown function [Polynucleobacter meluiroseus]
MKIEFIGPAVIAPDGGVFYSATLDGQPLTCHFSYEVLEDVDPETVLGDPLVHFSKHQLKLLSVAEQKILNGHAHASQIQIFSNDLPND